MIVSAQQLKALDKAATAGIWGQFSATHGPWQEQAITLWKKDRTAAIRCHDTSHDVSTIQHGSPKKIAHFTHADDAAFAESLVNAYRAGRIEYVDPATRAPKKDNTMTERTLSDVIRTIEEGEFYDDYDMSVADLGILRAAQKG